MKTIDFADLRQTISNMEDRNAELERALHNLYTQIIEQNIDTRTLLESEMRDAKNVLFGVGK
jgi:cell division GTPase FtsZ